MKLLPPGKCGIPGETVAADKLYCRALSQWYARRFFAEVSMDGNPIHLEVNQPYSASWAEDYYLTSYDVHSAEPEYCVVQIVREPLKYVMLLGIVMMLCGGLLLFLAGPDKQMSKSVSELVD